MTPHSSADSPIVSRIALVGRRSWQSVEPAPRPPAYTQGALALSYPVATGLEADPRSVALVAGGPDPAAGAEAWAAKFIQAVVEVIASDRPLTQLIRWTSRSVYADIARRQELVARHRGVGLVRSSRQQVATVRVCRPAAGGLEVAARVTFSGRSRAIAARLDYVRERWLCTAICFG